MIRARELSKSRNEVAVKSKFPRGIGDMGVACLNEDSRGSTEVPVEDFNRGSLYRRGATLIRATTIELPNAL